MNQNLFIAAHSIQCYYRFVGSKPIYIGVAIYHSGAYFNHDCYPSVARYFVGTSIVLKATHPIEVGEMVGENYGPIFTKKTLAERRRALMSRYWFKCECRCCKENWQVLDKLSNKARLKWVVLYFFYKEHCYSLTEFCIDAQHLLVQAFIIIRMVLRSWLNV